ncbi:hypothetical protein [Dubosiella newyorkensis]|uniref:hypothetical protein n=2 Tax=Dubosiella newyorkensis TaxID=1862672 RepID=UPI0025B3FE96|nr:hypothetical protein [Dubosiella newyorkensis]
MKKTNYWMAAMAAVLLFSGCAAAQNTPGAINTTPMVKESTETSKKAVLSAIKGMREKFKVEQGIDPEVLTHYLEYDKEIIKEVKVNDSKVEWNKPGTYEAIYTIQANLPQEDKKDQEQTSVEITEKVPVQIMTPEEVEEDKKAGGDAISKEDFEEDKTEEETKKPEQSEVAKPEEDKKEEESKPADEDKKPETKPDTGESKPSTSTKPDTNNGTTDSKPTTNAGTTTKPNTTPNKPAAHTHNWEAQYKTVQHAEIGHNEQYVIREAWTEYVPIYEWQTKYICNDCHQEFPYEMIWDHIFEEMENGGKGSYTDSPVQVQVGTQTIQHPAEYGTRYVIDKPAWTEKVLTGYKCSCGATKDK